MNQASRERQPERRADPILATLIDVAIAYRDNLGWRVAQAFMHEAGVPGGLAMRVLSGAATIRSTVPRRRTPGSGLQALRKSSVGLDPKPSASK